MRAMDSYVREQQQMRETVGRLALPHRAWTAHIETMASCFEATRFTLPTIDFDRIGDLIAAADAQSNLVASLTDRLVFRHVDLIESLGQPESLLASLPPAIADLPTLDLFVHTTAVRSITPHEPLEDEDEQCAAPLRVTIVTETALYLEQMLPDLKPAFLMQYRGMKARATDRGPDGLDPGERLDAQAPEGRPPHGRAQRERPCRGRRRTTSRSTSTGIRRVALRSNGCASSSRTTPTASYVRTELNSALALIELVNTAQHVDEFPGVRGPVRLDSCSALRSRSATFSLCGSWSLRPSASSCCC